MIFKSILESFEFIANTSLNLINTATSSLFETLNFSWHHLWQSFPMESIAAGVWLFVTTSQMYGANKKQNQLNIFTNNLMLGIIGVQ